MYALLAALSLLFPPPDLSNHWRWASASVNQSSTSPTPIPSPSPQPNPPTPVPSPIPSPSPSPYKIGDKCPNCDKGWLSTDSVVRKKCWKCKGDGIINDGDPILTGATEEESKNDKEERKEITPDTETKSNDGTGEKSLPPRNKLNPNSKDKINPDLKRNDPDSKAICYKPIYSKDGYWIWDLEGKKWLRSSKQPPTYKQVATGNWETKAYQYKSCNGRSCSWKTGYKKVWVAGPAKKVLQPSTPQASHYPVRGNWWSGCRNWTHLTKGVHAGKFNSAYLQSLSWEELQSLHSDTHEGRTKWQYVNK